MRPILAMLIFIPSVAWAGSFTVQTTAADDAALAIAASLDGKTATADDHLQAMVRAYLDQLVARFKADPRTLSKSDQALVCSKLALPGCPTKLRPSPASRS